MLYTKPHATCCITAHHIATPRKGCAPLAFAIGRPIPPSVHRVGPSPPHLLGSADRQGANFALEELAKTQYDVISLDWGVSPEDARRRVGPHKTLQVCLSAGSRRQAPMLIALAP